MPDRQHFPLTEHAPLYDALFRHSLTKPRSFHVPGHGFGRGMLPPWQAHYERILQLDATELSTTDNLHHAEGAIREAQRLAAACFGAEETHFLVGGSTAGNLAMILAVCAPGDLLLVQRNVHQSVLNGLMLAGATAVFLAPQQDAQSGLSALPALSALEEALRRYPHAKGALLTNPTYYGISADLTPYAAALHERGLPLLIDEAHGAHYGLHPALPPAALSRGADAVVQSTHKTLAAMTMGAMLHVQGERLSRPRLKQALAMVQSSSPSYPLMASLDIARAMIAREGAALFAGPLASAERFRQRVRAELPAFAIREAGIPYRHDPMRVVLQDSTAALSGYRLAQELERRGCWAEMSDSEHVVLLFGLGAAAEDADALADACADIAAAFGLTGRSPALRALGQLAAEETTAGMASVSAPIAFTRLLPDEAETEAVPLRLAVGRTSAEMVVPYPPGIPVLYPGEFISAAAARLLTEASAHGAVCQGAADPSLHTLRVYRQQAEDATEISDF